MSKWRHIVDVSQVFHEESMTYEGRRDRIVTQLRKLADKMGGADADLLSDLLDDLEGADNEDEFDSFWDEIYDWADDNRVWINT